MTVVKPLMTPVDRSRSTRRFTAGADSDTFVPISAYEARASATRCAMIRWSTASICNDSPPMSRIPSCFERRQRTYPLPDEPHRADPANQDILDVSAGALHGRVRHQSVDGPHHRGGRRTGPQAVATVAGHAHRPRS